MPSSEPSNIIPRTTEVLWNGTVSLPFMLKRKRNGAILVTKLKENRLQVSGAMNLRLGSELKLVSGFPVQQLTLNEVKKVMIRAPKPVSLVFINHDDVALDNMSFLSEDRESMDRDLESEYGYESTSVCNDPLYPIPRESSEWNDSSQRQTSSEYESMSPTPVRRRRRSQEYTSREGTTPPRKMSKLRQALDRMNELLNRPVRRSALNVAAGKSIVV